MSGLWKLFPLPVRIVIAVVVTAVVAALVLALVPKEFIERAFVGAGAGLTWFLAKLFGFGSRRKTLDITTEQDRELKELATKKTNAASGVATGETDAAKASANAAALIKQGEAASADIKTAPIEDVAKRL